MRLLKYNFNRMHTLTATYIRCTISYSQLDEIHVFYITALSTRLSKCVTEEVRAAIRREPAEIYRAELFESPGESL